MIRTELDPGREVSLKLEDGNHTLGLSPPLQCIITLQSGTMGMALNMDEEVRLYTTNAEREKFETRATLYGIIVGLDYLERAYVRDSVTAAE